MIRRDLKDAAANLDRLFKSVNGHFRLLPLLRQVGQRAQPDRIIPPRRQVVGVEAGQTLDDLQRLGGMKFGGLQVESVGRVERECRMSRGQLQKGLAVFGVRVGERLGNLKEHLKLARRGIVVFEQTVRFAEPLMSERQIP